MKLIELIHRKPVPAPWSEGDNIPWHEPGFSERMLKEHLSQEHHAASRKFERIDQHVDWIHQQVLGGSPGRILDLGCGPGLYACRLAKLGHQMVGIDYSPASIAYARRTARAEMLDCTFIEGDIREADYGGGFEAAMLIFGELNVFKPADARLILKKAHAALKPGGKLILEPHTFGAVKSLGEQKPSWYTSESGLFLPSPHAVLEEYFWDPEQAVTTIRYYVVDAASGEVTLHAQSFQAYTQQDYEALIGECGYTNIRFHPSLMGVPDPEQSSLLAILAETSGWRQTQ